MKLSKTILTLFFCLALVSSLLAQGTSQDTGTIRGTVKDTEGTPLPGVTITASGPAVMGTVTAVTGGDGNFRLALLRVGTYTVTAELQGFTTVRRENVYLALGATVTLMLDMTPAKLQEEVSVVATSPTIDVKTSSVSN